MIHFVAGLVTGFSVAIIMVSLQTWALERKRRERFDEEVRRVLKGD